MGVALTTQGGYADFSDFFSCSVLFPAKCVMAHLARGEVFDPDEVAIGHFFNRTTRRCFLMGEDPVSGKNFDHRKVWIEQYQRELAASFGIDLLGFAILSNHFHLILRSRPDVVATWDDEEVARRWLLLCPQRPSLSFREYYPILRPSKLGARRVRRLRPNAIPTRPTDQSAKEAGSGSCALPVLTRV